MALLLVLKTGQKGERNAPNHEEKGVLGEKGMEGKGESFQRAVGFGGSSAEMMGLGDSSRLQAGPCTPLTSNCPSPRAR